MSETFFTDRDLGLAFPEILKNAGVEVERHQDHFAHDATDEEWIGFVATRGWVAITHNERIRYTPNELATVRRHGARLLVVKGKAKFPDLARSFVRTLDSIRAFAANREGPYIAKVYQASPAELGRNLRGKGRIEPWWP